MLLKAPLWVKIFPIKIANTEHAFGMLSHCDIVNIKFSKCQFVMILASQTNSIHLYCIRVETEISEMGISKPQQIKLKLFSWLDNTRSDLWQK